MIERIKLKDAIIKLTTSDDPQLQTWLAMRKNGYSYRYISKISNPWVSDETIRLKVTRHQRQLSNCRVL